MRERKRHSYEIGLEKEEIDAINNEKHTKNYSLKKNFCEWVDSFVVSFVAVVIIFTFFLGKVKVDGESMMNTLIHEDQLIISNIGRSYQRGDIVIVSRNPENELTDDRDYARQPIVKRVIAVEGDTIQITDKGEVLVNDEVIDEPYIKDYEKNLGTPQEHMLNKETVPEGCIFIMGDNRHNSHDSRKNDVWMVDKRYVLGKVLFRVFPFEQAESFV